MDAGERETWRRADRVLDGLLDLPAAERLAQLENMDLSPALRDRVRRLLSAHERSAGPLDRTFAAGIAIEPQALSGRRLGRWRLDGELGRGGMAVVYRAQAMEGATGQIAAVKVLTLGALAGVGRERFLREQRALLRLRHPYIVPLYDAGVAEDGTPWLAMALVEGERIDQWCGRRGLDAQARIGLALQVGEALSYAHRNLVIHRDMKPSNVLVDEDGHVRLLDFGIARLADDAETEATATGLRALTPEYAAPEQFAGAPPSTAMDVYGLGALLYRLLTGRAPRPQGQRNADTQTLAPSRAARQDPALAPAARRETAKILRGDLDAILMKALAQEPERRYASIEAMTDDLRRWQFRRPVRARAPSAGYRLRKFAARHRLAVAAGAVVAALLGTGVAGVLWQAGRARAAAEESQAQLDYLGSVLDVLAPGTEAMKQPDKRQLIAEVARRARSELAQRPPLLATVELSLGGVAERVGDYAQASDLYRAALQRRRSLFAERSAEVAEARMHWGDALALRDPPDIAAAERELRAAVGVLRAERPGSALLVQALTAWAGKLGDNDRYRQANSVAAEAAALCERPALRDAQSCDQAWLVQGLLAHRAGRPVDAAAPLERLLALRQRRRGEHHADTLFVAGELGKVYARSGQRERGLALLEQVYAQQQRIYHRPTKESLSTLQSLSEVLADMSRFDRALALRQRYLQQARALYGENNGDVAVGYANLGSLYFADGRYAEAADAYRRAQDLYSRLYSPQHAGAMISQGNYADALREQGRAREALPLQQGAAAAMAQLFGQDSTRHAARLSNLARTELLLGDVAAALDHYDRSLAIYRSRQAPGEHSAAVVRAYRSQALLAAARIDEARSEADAALRDIEKLLGREHRYYWESLAFAANAACAEAGDDCAALQRAIAEQLQRQDVPGGARSKLEQAQQAMAIQEAARVSRR